MNAAYLTPAITLFNEDGTLDLVSQERLFNKIKKSAVDIPPNLTPDTADILQKVGVGARAEA